MSNSNEPSQFNGQLKSAQGSAVEAIGNLTGSTEWQKSGKETHAEGEGEIKAAQAKGYAEGLVDQASGYKVSLERAAPSTALVTCR